jgi:acetyl-CoA C-acetyltransferase
MPSPHIVGWSHLPSGKLDALDLEALVGQATSQALAHAQVDASEVDAVFVALEAAR